MQRRALSAHRTVRPAYGTHEFDASGNYLATMRPAQRPQSRNPLLGSGGGGTSLLAQAIAQEEARRQWLSEMINNPATQAGLRGLLGDLFAENPSRPNHGDQFSKAGSQAIDSARMSSRKGSFGH